MSGGAASAATFHDYEYWYLQGQNSQGPLSATALRDLVRNREITQDTLVWRDGFGDDWQRFDQSELAFTPRPHIPLAQPQDDPKWQETFQRFDEATDPRYFEKSWLGFIFGPLYYFYLRMWRKGFAIIGFASCATFILICAWLFLDFPGLQKYVGIITNAVCGVMVKGDYYRLKHRGERMWPSLARLDNPWLIAALILVPMFAIQALAAYGESVLSSNTPSSTATASTAPTTSRRSVTSSTIKDSFNPGSRPDAEPGAPALLDEAHYDASRKRAELNCAQWLQQNYGGQVANQYDDNTIYTYKVHVSGGDISSDSAHFGGHLTLAFNAQAVKYTNGIQSEFIDLPEHVCIMNPDLHVIGAEVSYKDGLQ